MTTILNNGWFRNLHTTTKSYKSISTTESQCNDRKPHHKICLIFICAKPVLLNLALKHVDYFESYFNRNESNNHPF